jgi:hypothetical protein
MSCMDSSVNKTSFLERTQVVYKTRSSLLNTVFKNIYKLFVCIVFLGRTKPLFVSEC